MAVKRLSLMNSWPSTNILVGMECQILLRYIQFHWYKSCKQEKLVTPNIGQINHKKSLTCENPIAYN